MLKAETYYSELVRIWISQTEAYWKSIDLFLVVQGILFVAVFQILSDGLDVAYALGIALIGLSFSVMWLVVCARKGVALRLLEHQLRHLEEEMFAERLETLAKAKNDDQNKKQELEKAIEGVFPMYFVGARAVLLKRKGRRRELPSYPHEADMKSHHLREIHQDDLKGIGSISRFGITSYGVPITFLVAWIIAASFIVYAIFC